MEQYKSIQMPLLVKNFNNSNICYNEVLPGDELKNYISSYWFLSSKTPIKNSTCITLLPDGCINIAFNLIDYNIEKNTFLIGLLDKPYKFKFKNSINIFGIRLLPGIGYAFFNHPANTFFNRIDLLINFIQGFQEYIPYHISFEKNLEENIPSIDFYIKKYIFDINPVSLDCIVESSLDYIIYKKGQVNINELASLCSISEKMLFRKYNKWVGMSPKLFSRIIRFQNTLLYIYNSENIDWTEVAILNGYYDQAHFIKEFKEFSGQCPSSLVYF